MLVIVLVALTIYVAATWDSTVWDAFLTKLSKILKDYGDFVGAVVGVTGAIGVFSASEWLKRRADRRELRRAAVERWLGEFHEQVLNGRIDSLRGRLLNRHVIELNFARKDRVLAWWMYEMVLATETRKRKSSTSWNESQSEYVEIWSLLSEVGEALTAWQHGELRAADFYVSYALRMRARQQQCSAASYAESVGLRDYLRPRRLTQMRELEVCESMLKERPGVQPIPPYAALYPRGAVRIARLMLVREFANSFKVPGLRLKIAIAKIQWVILKIRRAWLSLALVIVRAAPEFLFRKESTVSNSDVSLSPSAIRDGETGMVLVNADRHESKAEA